MSPTQKIALILLIMGGMALAGLAYLQFTSQTTYIAAKEIKANHEITAEDLTSIQFARLRDQTSTRLIITNRNQIIGKYAKTVILPEAFFLNNGMLLDEPPRERCFSTGRCLPSGHTVWQFQADGEDTLNGQVTVDDLVDIVLVDTEQERVSIIIQKILPLDILNKTTFLFAFTPEQRVLLDGVERLSGENEDVYLALYLTQELNPLLDPFQIYSYDKLGLTSDIFPLPTPTPVPGGGESIVQILFVTNPNTFLQTGAYQALTKNYEVTVQGVARNWQMAANVVQDLLRGEEDGHAEYNAPNAFIIGHDIPLHQTVQYITNAQKSSRLQKVRWCVVLNGVHATSQASSLRGLPVTTIDYQALSAAALAQSLQIRSLTATKAQILSALNMKGGSGKTTFTTTLGHSLAQRGLRVVIVDADTSDGDVRTAFGLDLSLPELDKLAEALLKPKASAEAVLKKYIHPYTDNLHLLLSPADTYIQDNLNEEIVDLIMTSLLNLRYEVILVDLPGAIRATPFTSLLTRMPQAKFYLLHHPDSRYERDGSDRAKALLQRIGCADKLALVAVGSADSKWRPLEQKAVEEATSLPIQTYLPHDPLVQAAQMAGGVPLAQYLEQRKSEAGVIGFLQKSSYLSAIENLADGLLASIKDEKPV